MAKQTFKQYIRTELQSSIAQKYARILGLSTPILKLCDTIYDNNDMNDDEAFELMGKYRKEVQSFRGEFASSNKNVIDSYLYDSQRFLYTMISNVVTNIVLKNFERFDLDSNLTLNKANITQLQWLIQQDFELDFSFPYGINTLTD